LRTQDYRGVAGNDNARPKNNTGEKGIPLGRKGASKGKAASKDGYGTNSEKKRTAREKGYISGGEKKKERHLFEPKSRDIAIALWKKKGRTY